MTASRLTAEQAARIAAETDEAVRQARNAYLRARRVRNHDKVISWERAYREKNRDKISSYQREYQREYRAMRKALKV